jgi:peptidoglycan/xylan/chitin deacetylase (PgdA/CDA1 family)
MALLFSLTVLILPVRAAPGRKYVALTFDDGPSGKYTRTLLDGLYDRGARATFLLCGYRIKDYPDIAQRIFEEGHEIGLHGYSHDPMKSMSRRTIAQELMDTEALLPEGCHPVFLRPPGGFSSDGVRQVAQAKQLGILSWSVDPRDWATANSLAIEKAVLDKVKDGDIILLHDMSDSSVRAALHIIDTLRSRGFRCVTVSELAKIRDTAIRPGKSYCRFPKE